MALSKFFDFIGNTFGGSDGNFSFEDLIFTNGKLDGEKLGGIAALFTSSGGLGLGSSYFGRPDQPVGYQGSVPDYTAVRRRVPITDDPNRRPGSGGRRYFTDMQYATTPESEPITLEEAQAAAEKQVEELSLAQAPKGISSVIPSTAPPSSPIAPPAPASAVIENMPVPTFSAKPITSSNDIKMGTGSSTPGGVVLQQSEETPRTQGMAAGGEVIAQLMANPYFVGGGLGLDAAGLAYLFKSMYGNLKGEGSKSPIVKATGGMLGGATDGMADKVPAMIDNSDPAALSDGEYVLTADGVSQLGNGNSDAGAKVLDEFMGYVRMARTGTKKQAPEINSQKFLPKV